MLKKSTFFVTSLGYHNDSHLSTNLNNKAPKIKELQERLLKNESIISIDVNLILKEKKNSIVRSKLEKKWANWTLCNMKKQSAV